MVESKGDWVVVPDIRVEKGNVELVGFDVLDRETDKYLVTSEGICGDPENVAVAGLMAASKVLYDAAKEAILQIDYLHEKFDSTGSGEAVIARLRSAVRLADKPQLVFANEGDAEHYKLLMPSGMPSLAS